MLVFLSCLGILGGLAAELMVWKNYESVPVVGLPFQVSYTLFNTGSQYESIIFSPILKAFLEP